MAQASDMHEEGRRNLLWYHMPALEHTYHTTSSPAPPADQAPISAKRQTASRLRTSGGLLRSSLDAEPLVGLLKGVDLVHDAVLVCVLPVVCDEPLRPGIVLLWPVAPARIPQQLLCAHL